jgi:hypothetical protein
MSPRRVCLEPGCPRTTVRTRCPEHERARDRTRGSAAQRGYGAEHRRLSEELRAQAIGSTCHFCGEPMRAGQRLALDHTLDRTGYRGVVHLSCNSADAGGRLSS